MEGARRFFRGRVKRRRLGVATDGGGCFRGGIIRLVARVDFFNDARMPDVSLPANLAAPVPAWNEDVIYEVLGNPVRRRLVLALARGGPQVAGDLKVGVGRRVDATLKHLVSLRKSGLVVQQENPGDGRKFLYALAANVPVTQTADGAVLDFGFLTVRL